MFASTAQSATFFFIPDASRSSNKSVPQPSPVSPVSPSATAPVRVTWIVG